MCAHKRQSRTSREAGSRTVCAAIAHGVAAKANGSSTRFVLEIVLRFLHDHGATDVTIQPLASRDPTDRTYCTCSESIGAFIAFIGHPRPI